MKLRHAVHGARALVASFPAIKNWTVGKPGNEAIAICLFGHGNFLRKKKLFDHTNGSSDCVHC